MKEKSEITHPLVVATARFGGYRAAHSQLVAAEGEDTVSGGGGLVAVVVVVRPAQGRGGRACRPLVAVSSLHGAADGRGRGGRGWRQGK